MNKHGYEQDLNESPHIVETSCMSCKGAGKLTTMRLRDVEPEEMICVFKCESCGDKSVSFFDKMYDKRGRVKIECSFDDPKDLHREVNLNQLASVEIISDRFSYKYESSIPGVYTVESLLRQAEDEIKNLCGKDDITSGGRGKILGETDVSKEECEKQLNNVGCDVPSEELHCREVAVGFCPCCGCWDDQMYILIWAYLHTQQLQCSNIVVAGSLFNAYRPHSELQHSPGEVGSKDGTRENQVASHC